MNNVDLGIIWNALKDDVTELVNTRLQLLKLEVYEKTSTIASTLIFGLIVVNLVFFSLLFAFIALGFLFSEWLNNYAGGFALVVVLYLILFGVIFLCRIKILRWMENLVLKVLYPDLGEKNNQSKNNYRSNKNTCSEEGGDYEE